LLGDAELDEGAVWEALNDPAVPRMGELLWVVDYNRQSLDQVVRCTTGTHTHWPSSLGLEVMRFSELVSVSSVSRRVSTPHTGCTAATSNQSSTPH
jgi:transketolase N-terminal domain/subunit